MIDFFFFKTMRSPGWTHAYMKEFLNYITSKLIFILVRNDYKDNTTLLYNTTEFSRLERAQVKLRKTLIISLICLIISSYDLLGRLNFIGFILFYNLDTFHNFQ